MKKKIISLQQRKLEAFEREREEFRLSLPEKLAEYDEEETIRKLREVWERGHIADCWFLHWRINLSYSYLPGPRRVK
jgi:hypothetical protein